MTTTAGSDWMTAGAVHDVSVDAEDVAGGDDRRPEVPTSRDMGGVERRLYRLIAGWTVAYAVGSWLLEFLYSRFGVRHPDPVALAVKCVVYAVVWAPLLGTAVSLSFRWPVRGRRDLGRIVLHLLTALAAPFVWGTLSYALCLWLAPGWQALGLARMYRTTGYSVLYVYSVVVLICHGLLDVRRRYAERVAALDLAERAARARLQVLTMELQPHFVGNALHAVSELLYEAPTRAAEALRRLRDLLAAALEADRRAHVTVREEITMLRWYTDTQALRFGDRMRMDWDIDPTVLDDAVPTMFLQPLVENAIKFSVEAVNRQATVRVQVSANDGRLAARVCDDGVGLGNGGRRGAGIGLANVRERLRQMYGADYELRLVPAVSGLGTVVEISIPRRAMSPAASPPETRAPYWNPGTSPAVSTASSQPYSKASAWAHSVLRRLDVWGALVGWALAFGTASWVVDLVIVTASGSVPTTAWRGSGRVVESLLTIPTLAVAIATAERWPVRTWRDGRRIVGQAAIALVIGPLWGVVAYALNPALSLWNPAVGRWGLIAIEAKGVLFAYGTAAVLAHVALRLYQERARELELHALRTDLVEARVRVATLGFHTQRVTAALDAVIARLPHDTVGANEILVGVATAIEGALALGRSDTVLLRDVFRLADAHAELVEGRDARDVLQWEASDRVLATRVTPMSVWPELAQAINDAAVTGAGVHVRCTALAEASSHGAGIAVGQPANGAGKVQLRLQRVGIDGSSATRLLTVEAQLGNVSALV